MSEKTKQQNAPQIPLINDPLFKNFIDYAKQFVIEDLLHKNAQEFKQALIDLNVTKKEMNLTDNDYLFQIILRSQELACKSSINNTFELIFEYHEWLAGNYELVPKNEDH